MPQVKLGSLDDVALGNFATEVLRVEAGDESICGAV